jgi:hypothetical protein
MFLVQNRRSKRSWRVFARRTPGPAVSREIRATREFDLQVNRCKHFSDRLLVLLGHKRWINSSLQELEAYLEGR